ncbi:MAG: aminotransferase class IV family protein, partial [Acidobacteria bacterium]|nr:aminotransferase class IV family protein [Acidobacteriota bacterium]
MDSLIFHNDRIAPLTEVHLSPGQTGLLMGWGVFTTLRIYRGVPFAFERHWARITRDAERLEIEMPFQYESVRKAIMDLAAANHQLEGVARVSFVKNQGGLWAQADGLPPTDLIIFTRPLVAWPAAHRLALQPGGIFSGGSYAGAKMLSWVPHIASLQRAHEAGFDDALLLNEKNHLAECTSANIFLVRRGEILTPPLSSGCLAGITREVLLEIAPGSGFKIREVDLTTEDLSTVEEVFISSTTREVAGLSFINPEWHYPCPGNVTAAIGSAFKE